jgi:proteasome lid subunit RPN8/RPN11
VVSGPNASGPKTASAGHPGPASVVLPRAIREAIVAQARAEQPNEACGIILGAEWAGVGGRAIRYEPCRNKAASPYRYEVHAQDLYRLTVAADDHDQVFWGIVHSHTHTPARPSPTDIGLAFYPDALYLLVSLSPDEADPSTGAESLRAWRILDGVVHEVAITIEG